MLKKYIFYLPSLLVGMLVIFLILNFFNLIPNSNTSKSVAFNSEFELQIKITSDELEKYSKDNDNNSDYFVALGQNFQKTFYFYSNSKYLEDNNLNEVFNSLETLISYNRISTLLNSDKFNEFVESFKEVSVDPSDATKTEELNNLLKEMSK